MNETQTIIGIVIAFFGDLFTGFLTAYFKYLFDAEKSRFEFRMKVLRELWEVVVYARSLATNLDPVGEDIVDSNETLDMRRERRLEEFFPAHLEAKKVMRFNEPFYPIMLHDLAAESLSESMSLARTVADPSRRALKEYYSIIKEKTQKLNQLTDRLRDAIREEVHRSPLSPVSI